MRLDPGDVCLEVRPTAEDDVVFRRLAPAAFVFRRALASARCLDAAAAEAVDEDPAFDLAAALANFLADAIVVGFGIEERRGGNA